MHTNLLRVETVGLALLLCAGSAMAEPVKAFCIDFNWGAGGPNDFAEPGLWADASPEEHVAWYEGLGANVIQTFAVSCNGYAWYKGGIVPEQPGLEHDFLTEMVNLGHARDMKVMGYFCIGANTRWAQENPDLSYGAPSATHIPFTTEYLDYLCAAIEDALRVSGMDGFMIDWMFNTSGQWLECEQRMYEELMGEAFLGAEQVDGEAMLEFNRRAVDRCWGRIRETAKSVNPDCVIWLSCHDVLNPMVATSRMFREVDWLMNEATDPSVLSALVDMKGDHTRLLQCVVGWGDGHNARGIITADQDTSFDLYGFSKPGPDSLPLPISDYLDNPIASFGGNDRNIAVLARHYTGLALDDVVAVDGDEDVLLLPETANTRGASPVVEEGQIGRWANAADSVEWMVDLEHGGTFEVELEYACQVGSGGSSFSVMVGDRSFDVVADETGTWRDYITAQLGSVDVPVGRLVVVIKPSEATPWKAVSVRSVGLRRVR